MTIRKFKLYFCCSFLVLLAGCWDQVDIEERGFVIGSAIDLADEETNEENQLKLTNQFVVPSGLGAPTQGGGSKQAFANLTAVGESMYDIEREMATLTSRAPFFEHLKVIVISEKIATKPQLFANIMDLYLRNQEMRRGVKILISEGEAKQVFEVLPNIESLPVMYINSIIENSFKSVTMMKPVKIGEVHEYLLDLTSYIIPKITVREGVLQYKGGVVFHGYNNKMVGELNGKDAKGLNFITGKGYEGSVDFKINDHTVQFKLDDVNSKIKIDAKDKNNIVVSVSINTVGSIAETFATQNLLDKKTIEKMEEQIAEEMEKIANQTIKKIQEELKADVLGIGKLLHQRHYDLWQTVKHDWDHGENYFAKCTFNVSANASIRTTGTLNKTNN